MDQCSLNRQDLADGFKRYRNVFVALGDETRQHIFFTLLENEEIGMRVPEITEKTNLSRPAVSHHLRVLKDANLVGMHRVGTMNYYYVDANESCWHGLRALIDAADDIVSLAVEAGYPRWECSDKPATKNERGN